ncbi:MAG: efflux RND transporter periplasmic adaptor subunit [Methylotenera sp.]|jgi:membrane fusion protein, heavy metal efflux system
MNQLISIISIALLLPLTGFAESLSLSEAQIKQMQVTTKPVRQGAGSYVRQYSAEVTLPNNQTQIVSMPQHGLVSALLVATGQEVEKGQVIAEISSSDFIGLQGEYLQAKTKLALATKTAMRDKALAEEGIIPQRRYIESKSAQEALYTEVMQTKQALHLAGMTDKSINRLSSASKMQSVINIVVPMGGQVVAQYAKVGDRLDSGMPLYQIAQLNPLWVEMNVPIEEAANLEKGLAVKIPKGNASGKIIAILRSVNKATQTLQVRAEINQGTETLSLGQFVEVVLLIKTQAGSIQVPKSSLIRNGQKSFVFKRNKNGFEVVPVIVLNEDDQYALIQGSLNASDEVATTGLAALKGSWLGLGGE